MIKGCLALSVKIDGMDVIQTNQKTTDFSSAKYFLDDSNNCTIITTDSWRQIEISR